MGYIICKYGFQTLWKCMMPKSQEKQNWRYFSPVLNKNERAKGEDN